MRKKHTYTSVFNTNRFILFCVIFAISMIFTVGTGIFIGGLFYFNILDFFAVAIFCAAPSITFALFDHTPGLKYFRDDRCNPWLSILAHYLMSLVLMMLAVFVLGFFEPFYSSPHWNISGKMFAQYTPGYVVFTIGMIVIDVRKTAIANNNLKKLKLNKRRLS